MSKTRKHTKGEEQNLEAPVISLPAGEPNELQFQYFLEWYEEEQLSTLAGWWIKSKGPWDGSRQVSAMNHHQHWGPDSPRQPRHRILLEMVRATYERYHFEATRQPRHNSILEVAKLISKKHQPFYFDIARQLPATSNIFPDHIPIPYTSHVKITGQILEVREDKVVVNCLLDEESKEFQVRRFDREILEGAVNLEIGASLEINIYTKPGERKFVYKNVAAKNTAEIFNEEEENIFAKFANSSLFDPLPSVNEDQL